MAVKHGGRGPGHTSRKTRIGSFTGGGEPADTAAPTITSTNPSDTYVEGVAIGGTLTADEAVTWSKTGTDAARVTLNASTGVWSLEATDYETKTSYSWTFTATDAATNATNQVVVITIANDTSDDSLAAPVVTLTSAAGDPPEATISNLSTGLYLRIQRTTTAGNYTSPTMEILYGPVDDDDTANGISNAKLADYGYTDPTGFWAQRYRYERDDGIVSSWSNEISGTVTAVITTWGLKSTHITLSNSDLTATGTGGGGVGADQPVISSTFKTAGKKYAEILVNPNGGFVETKVGLTNGLPANYADPGNTANAITHRRNGNIRHNNATLANALATEGVDPYLAMIAVDADADKVWFGAGGVWNGDPAANSGGYSVSSIGTYYLLFCAINDDAGTLRRTSSEFSHSPPSGFTGWDD